MRKLTTKEFVLKAREVHSEKYLYNKTIYKTSRLKIVITCPIHGDFELLAASHLLGFGCPKCSGLIKSTTELFISRANKVHNNKYDYSKVEYVNNKTKVCIICPEHGEFWLKPNDHLGGHGCEKCGNVLKGLSGRLTTKLFITRASAIHNGKYNYSKTIYTKSTEKVIITCPIHGDYLQEANAHLQGHGCPKCNSGSLKVSFISRGEKLVENLLRLYHINFIPLFEVNIDKKINPSGLAYIDFYLPDYNIFIEYNGEQHYIPKEFFGGEIAFSKLLLRDLYIREYCSSSCIKLIEFSYKQSKEEIEKQIKTIIND